MNWFLCKLLKLNFFEKKNEVVLVVAAQVVSSIIGRSKSSSISSKPFVLVSKSPKNA